MPHPGASLTSKQRELLRRARKAVLGTTAPNGRPRLVPLAFAAAGEDGQALVVYSAIDEKPKSVADPRALARVRDVLARPGVSILIDEWDEDWTRLAWLRLDGTASLLEPGQPSQATEQRAAVRLLRARYPQYATHRLEERPILRILVERVTAWDASR